MLHAMIFRLSSPTCVVFFALALASVGMTGCSKDSKTDGDAAADAAPEASVADAAAAADAAVDATTTPLTTATAAPVKPKTAAPDPPICERARAAKARNAPTFPALEKQCKALGGSI
jgi:hypothetical protein